MNRISIPNGRVGELSPDGTRIAFGNTTAKVLDIARGTITDFGPYAVAGWQTNRLLGIRDFQMDRALRIVNVETGAVEWINGVSHTAAQIRTPRDGTVWTFENGIFRRNGVAILSGHSGDLSGQVLSLDGSFVSAERLDLGYRTAVYNYTGAEHFVIDRQAIWAQMFNFNGTPALFHTINPPGQEQAVFDMPDGRHVVAGTVPENRGALVTVDSALWAATFAFLDGLPYGFIRPWNDPQGIRLQMPGGLMDVRYQPATRTFVLAAHDQTTGELVIWDGVSIDTPRKYFTEDPDTGGGTPPQPEPPPATDIIEIRVKAGASQLIRVTAVP